MIEVEVNVTFFIILQNNNLQIWLKELDGSGQYALLYFNNNKLGVPSIVSRACFVSSESHFELTFPSWIIPCPI